MALHESMSGIAWAKHIGGELPEGWLPPSRGSLEEYHLYRSLGIVATSTPVLHTLAQRIPEDAITSGQTREVVDALYRTAEGIRKAGGVLLGLAAPQIGYNASIFLADLSGSENGAVLGDLEPFINPDIQPVGDAMHGCHQSCFSCTTSLFGYVERPAAVQMTAWTPRGKRTEGEYRQMAAHVAQHEDAHLQGKLFPDTVVAAGGTFDWLPLELRPYYVQQGGEPSTWPLTVPHAQWEAMRSGEYSFDNFRLAE